jgi:LysM repeat protein
MKTFLKTLGLGFMLASLASYAEAQGTNLLTNPGFENPFNQQLEAISVAQGWTAWWVEPDSSPAFPSFCNYLVEPPSCQPYHRPEYAMAFPYGERIRGGGNAQKYFSFYSTHLAGLYQQVTGVVPGRTYRFSVFMMAWSTNQDKGFVSAGQPSMGLQVGIDPNGGSDPFSANIVWSPTQNGFDTWTLFAVDAAAQSSTVTVFTRSWPNLALQHNDVYVDDAYLEATGPGAELLPTSPPVGGASTPLPAVTFVPQAPLFPYTSTPLPSGEIWYTVQPGDTLLRIAYYHQTTVDDIKSLNNLTSNTIYSNQKLLIKIATPLPVPTSTPEVILSPTPPTQPQPLTHTPASIALSPDYGQLCVVAYNDANRNATNDNEPTLADVRVTLSVGSTPLDGYVTTGGEGSHCFPQLPSGVYTVSVAAPAGYTTSTASEATVNLQSGNLVTLAFGIAEVAAAPSVVSPETPASGTIVLIVGGIVALVVMIGLGTAVVRLAKKK